ncbi:Mrr restriction system protein [Clostridium perfringens]|nr:restriction endonuclease [Clostridium perfringens]MDG6893028.1 Mrr restriction system protein [Clostridium perfringens]
MEKYCYRKTRNSKVFRGFRYSGGNKGVFITTSKFSREAREYVENINTKKIILIDCMQLAQYMIDFNVGVSTEIVYEVKRIDSDYFIEED